MDLPETSTSSRSVAASCARELPSTTKHAGILKERNAQAAAEVKHDAEAVAAGIREGWIRDKPLDLSTATKEQLLSLPAATPAEAETGEMVTRRIMPKIGDAASASALNVRVQICHITVRKLDRAGDELQTQNSLLSVVLHD